MKTADFIIERSAEFRDKVLQVKDQEKKKVSEEQIVKERQKQSPNESANKGSKATCTIDH